jgi:hypothetical protein
MRLSARTPPVHQLTSARVCPTAARALFGLGVAAALVAMVAPSVASAGGSAKVNTFNFSGALVGALKITTTNCAGSVATPNGATFEAVIGKLKGSKADDWNIMIVTPKNGTYKLHPGQLAGIELNPSPMGTNWGHATGTLTVKGSTGSINAELSSADAGKIHVVGSWSCPAG